MYRCDFKKGPLTYKDIEDSGIIILDYDDDESRGKIEPNLLTFTELRMFRIHLTDEERATRVKAFKKGGNGFYTPLYNYVEICERRRANLGAESF